MEFQITRALEILQRTPAVIESMLEGLSDEWLYKNEGGESWSPYDILGHLIHGERTDWISRMDIILEGNEDNTFTPFDRFAQFEESKGKTLNQLLDEFSQLRKHNLNILRGRQLTQDELKLKATHPELGKVSLSQLLASWVVHDLNHIAQISRVMAYQYRDEVGPWKAYMGILNH